MPKGPGAAKSGAGTVWVDVRGDTSGLTKDIAASAKTAGGAVASSLGSGARTVLGDLGRAAGVASVAVGGIAAAAVKVSANFNESMSGVGAVANASAAELDTLREAALQAGAATSFSASEAAEAQAELVKAGVSTADVLGGGLMGSLSLAAAGQLNLADAATISAQAMNVFKLGGKDVGHIADVLAAGANKSAADVKQLGDALRQGGLVAAQTGLSLEETTGVLSMFADRALIGSDAGTSLKTMLQRLVPSGAPAAAMMEQLGLKFFDAKGAFVGIDQVAQQLQTSMAGLSDEQRSQALTTIFGSDAVRAASILMDGGAKKVREYTDAVNDQGAAQRMAATQLDNLKGDIEEFSGATETALIRIGDLGDKSFRAVVQGASRFVNVFNDFATTSAWSAIGSNIDRLAGSAGDAFDGMADRLEKVLAGVSASDVDRFFGRLERGAKVARKSIEGMEGVIAGVGVSLSTMALRSIPLIGGLVPAIAPVTGVLGGLVLGSDEGRKALVDLGKQAGRLASEQGPKLARSMADLSKLMSGALAGAIEDVGGAAIDAARVLGPVLGDAIDELGPPLAHLISAGAELAGKVLPELADLAGVVVPPAVGVLADAVGVAADALGFLADHADIALTALGGLAGWKLGSGLVNIGSTIATAVGPLKTAAADFSTFYQVLRAEGAGIGGAVAGATRETGLLAGVLGGLNPVVVGVTAAVAAGAFLWQRYANEQKKVKAISDDLTEALGQEKDAFEKDVRDNYLESLGKSLPLINRLNIGVTELANSAITNREEFRQMGIDIGNAVRDPLSGDILPVDEAMRRFRQTLDGLPEDVRNIGDAVAQLVASGDITIGEARDLFSGIDDLSEGLGKSLESNRDRFKAMAQDAFSAGTITEQALHQVSKAFDDASTPEEMNAAVMVLLGLMGDTSTGAEKMADSINKALDALRSLRGEFEKFAELDRDVDAAQRSLADATDRTIESFTQGAGISLDSKQGRANADALETQIKLAEALAELQAKQDSTGLTSTATLNAQAEALLKLRDAGSLTADEYQRLLDLYGLTPAEITTTVQADIADAAADIESLKKQIEDTPGITEDAKAHLVALVDEGSIDEARRELAVLSQDRTVRIRVATDAWLAGEKVSFADLLGIAPPPKPKGARASGGGVTPGDWLVGEEGPELLRISQPGYVFNANQTRDILKDKSLPGDQFIDGRWLDELRSLRSDFTSLADAIAALATRPQAAPVVDVHASAGVEVSAETRFRKAAR